MKKITTAAFLAVLAFGNFSANAALTKEQQQSVEYYLGTGPCPAELMASAPCGVDMPCVQGPCPSVKGIFDGGLCCNGKGMTTIFG